MVIHDPFLRMLLLSLAAVIWLVCVSCTNIQIICGVYLMFELLLLNEVLLPDIFR